MKLPTNVELPVNSVGEKVNWFNYIFLHPPVTRANYLEKKLIKRRQKIINHVYSKGSRNKSFFLLPSLYPLPLLVDGPLK